MLKTYSWVHFNGSIVFVEMTKKHQDTEFMITGASCLLGFLAISFFMALLFDTAKNCTSVINYHVWNLFFFQGILHDIISVIFFEHAEGQFSAVVRSSFRFKDQNKLVRVFRTGYPCLQNQSSYTERADTPNSAVSLDLFIIITYRNT